MQFTMITEKTINKNIYPIYGAKGRSIKYPYTVNELNHLNHS